MKGLLIKDAKLPEKGIVWFSVNFDGRVIMEGYNIHSSFDGERKMFLAEEIEIEDKGENDE